MSNRVLRTNMSDRGTPLLYINYFRKVYTFFLGGGDRRNFFFLSKLPVTGADDCNFQFVGHIFLLLVKKKRKNGIIYANKPIKSEYEQGVLMNSKPQVE